MQFFSRMSEPWLWVCWLDYAFHFGMFGQKNENARQLSSKARLIYFGIVDKVLTGKMQGQVRTR